MKECNICKEIKPESEFDQRKNKNVKYCKECRREKIRKHYRENTDYYIKKAKVHTEKNIISFENYKKSLFCSDCNFSFKDEPYLCDFHHINKKDKLYNIAKIRNSSLERIMKEIEKCIPLCPICHRRRHHTPLAKLEKPLTTNQKSEGSNPLGSS